MLGREKEHRERTYDFDLYGTRLRADEHVRSMGLGLVFWPMGGHDEGDVYGRGVRVRLEVPQRALAISDFV